MEPDIGELAQSVQEYISELLKREIEEDNWHDPQETRQVNIRLPVSLYDTLEQLATRFGKSKTAMATSLLELAIIEANDFASNPGGVQR